MKNPLESVQYYLSSCGKPVYRCSCHFAWVNLKSAPSMLFVRCFLRVSTLRIWTRIFFVPYRSGYVQLKHVKRKKQKKTFDIKLNKSHKIKTLLYKCSEVDFSNKTIAIYKVQPSWTSQNRLFYLIFVI